MLAGLLMADLAQTKSKLLQQACAANMKQWGMAFSLYAQDYNGTFYYDVGGAAWDDVFLSNNPPNPYLRYLGGGNLALTIRSMRICPARAVTMSQSEINGTPFHSYAMPIGNYRKGFGYVPADASGSPFYGGAIAPYWPNLKSVPMPTKFLVLIESRGNTISCGSTALHDAVTQPHAGPCGDTVPAINRHSALVNCLFGDYHVEPLAIGQIDAMDGNCSSASPPNYTFALN